MMENLPPAIFKDFCCIADIDKMLLAAVVSSYVGKAKKYLPLFEFPHVTGANLATEEQHVDQHHMSKTRAKAFNIKIHNSIRRLAECNNIILVGLNADQKSYLTFLSDFNVIEVDTLEEVDSLLGPFREETSFLRCREEDVLSGLQISVSCGKVLKIDSSADALSSENTKARDLVVLEDIGRVASVIAVNYALATGAGIKIIKPARLDHRQITNLIQAWREGHQESYNDLSAALYKELHDVDFMLFQYATFFTEGAPYSLILKNIIPFCHVHYQFSVDFFVFNAIYFEKKEKVPSAIVFSPREFDDEETDHVELRLQQGNYYVRKLIANDASASNLDNHVQHYPFELLHICSHGGEVGGYSISEKFTDRYGTVHTVEYDEVVTFAPEQGEEKIKVLTKMLWRKFDGLTWKSKELEDKNYSNEIYSDMFSAVSNKIDKKRTKKDVVPNSSAIKCSDFNYQAMFNHIAAGNSPIVFNNTCWSWSDIADSFLAAGARTYIGTLWKVRNDLAARTAERFYDELFFKTALSAMHEALEITAGTDNENIYIVWGLPFVSLKEVDMLVESKKEVLEHLILSAQRWEEKLEKTRGGYLRENITAILRWIQRQINKDFKSEFLEMLSDGRIRVGK